MLKQRIITAVILLAILLPALFWRTPEPFMAITLILLAAAGWEWGKLNGFAQGPSLALGALTALLCAGAWAAGWTHGVAASVWIVAGAAWVLIGAMLLR